MIIGDDEPIRIDNEARAEALAPLGRKVAKEALEEFAKGVVPNGSRSRKGLRKPRKGRSTSSIFARLMFTTAGDKFSERRKNVEATLDFRRESLRLLLP